MGKIKNKKVEDNTSKKNIIIVVLVILVVLLVGIVGWFIYMNKLEDKTTGSNWSDKYYEFLKNQKNNKKLSWMFNNKSKITFVESEAIKDPLMLVKNNTKCPGNDNDCEEMSVLGIVDGKVEFFTGSTSKKEEARLYYNIEKKEYKYYIKSTYEGNEKYCSLDTIVTDYEKYNVYKESKKRKITDYNSEEYKKLQDEIYKKQSEDTTREEINIDENNVKVTQETIDGKIIEYNNIDSQIVDTGVVLEYFEYDKDMTPIKIRDEIIEGRKNYKELDRQVTKEIDKLVKKQVDLIEKTKQDIEKAKEEKQVAEESKKAEEEKKKAEEAIKDGIKVGNYTLKYGKYIGSSASEGNILVLNPNGACTFNGASCSYSIGTHDFAQDESTRGSYEECLIIKTDYTQYLMPYNNMSIGDGDIGEFNYVG